MATKCKSRRSKPPSAAGKRTFRYDAKLGCMVEVIAKYDSKAGRIVETTKPIDDKPTNKDWLKPRGVYGNGRKISLWPMVSNNAAVLPKHIARRNKVLKAAGVQQTDHDRFGRPKWESKRHKAEYLRAIGRCDLDASYGDAAPLRFDGKVDPQD